MGRGQWQPLSPGTVYVCCCPGCPVVVVSAVSLCHVCCGYVCTCVLVCGDMFVCVYVYVYTCVRVGCKTITSPGRRPLSTVVPSRSCSHCRPCTQVHSHSHPSFKRVRFTTALRFRCGVCPLRRPHTCTLQFVCSPPAPPRSGRRHVRTRRPRSPCGSKPPSPGVVCQLVHRWQPVLRTDRHDVPSVCGGRPSTHARPLHSAAGAGRQPDRVAALHH